MEVPLRAFLSVTPEVGFTPTHVCMMAEEATAGPSATQRQHNFSLQEVVDIVTYGDDSDLVSVDSLDGCDSHEEVVYADDISTLLEQVSATAIE